jgi:hypothetical protein
VSNIQAVREATEFIVPTSKPKAQRTSWWKEVNDQGIRVTLRSLLDRIRTEATPLVRWLLYVVLLLVLLAVGLDSLYVTKGATFGAHPFADYLSLILWGLGSDVAGRTLANPRGSGQ